MDFNTCLSVHTHSLTFTSFDDFFDTIWEVIMKYSRWHCTKNYCGDSGGGGGNAGSNAVMVVVMQC